MSVAIRAPEALEALALIGLKRLSGVPRGQSCPNRRDPAHDPHLVKGTVDQRV